ncbi:hypothetical protein Aperf_G00000086162 [Anoplocephala perfoliata]
MPTNNNGTSDLNKRPRSLINVYRRASKLFAQVTQSNRSQSKQKEWNTKSKENTESIPKKDYGRNRHWESCPLHGSSKYKVMPTGSKDRNALHHVCIVPPRKRSPPLFSTNFSPIKSTPMGVHLEHSVSDDPCTYSKHSSTLSVVKTHTPIIRRSSTSSDESRRSSQARMSLMAAFRKKLSEENSSKCSNKSSLRHFSSSDDVCAEPANFSLRKGSKNSTQSVDSEEGIEVHLMEKYSDGTYLVQFRRSSSSQRFGVYFSSDANGYYISKQTRNKQCQNNTFSIHAYDRVLSIQGVPSKLLSPNGIQEMLQGCLIMNVKIAPFKCN